MSTITLPNIRVSSDLTVKLKLKDGGVALDWSTLTNIKVSIYSDAQRALAGRCSVAIDEDDATLLVCTYAANKPQYVGVNRVVVSAKYLGETKTYDKPAFNFVRWTDDQEGQTITIDDPDIDVEISVEDVSSSILQEAVDAANTAAERANDAAEAAEHMVDIHTGPQGKSAYEVAVDEGYTGTEEEWLASLKGDTGETPDITIGTVTTAEPGTPAAATMTGTPEDPVLNLTIPKGAVGATPNFTVGTVTTGEPGTPVVVTLTGTPEAPVLNITIPQGMQGNTGSSVDYPYELVNNLTTNDATKGLSAAQGKVLKDELSQLEAKITTRATSVSDADYAIRATTGSSSLTDNPSGTRVRIVFPVTAGDIIRISSTYPSGCSAGIWDTPEHCVNAGRAGTLQGLSDYTTSPITGVSNYTAYVGVSFTNGSTAISDSVFQAMLNSLSVFIGGDVKADINSLQAKVTEQDAEIAQLDADMYAAPIVGNTTTNSLTPSSYVNKSGNPIEDTSQVMPAGAKLTAIKLFSTGSKNTSGKTHLSIYDENRVLVKEVELGNIEATDTTFNVSDKNIIIQEGYHYAFDRVGYKYDTSIPNGRFIVATTGNNADSKSWFGWTFTYEMPQTKLEKLMAENPDLFPSTITVNNPLPVGNYDTYDNGSPVEDLWQDLPVGAKLTKVHCAGKGTAGSNFTFLHIYDATRTLVGSRIQLGAIAANGSVFDISSQNIIVQEGYHYALQYVARVYIGNNINNYRYYIPSNDTSIHNGYQLGFSFSYEYEGKEVKPSVLSGKYASYIGDSICNGAGYAGGYALQIARKKKMLPPQNLGSSGGIVTTDTNESRVYINTMVAKMDTNADYLIAEGGVNDADLSEPLGAISEGFTATLDNTTFYGAMETLCKELATVGAGKKIGYIFAHRVSTTTKYAFDYSGANNYYNAAKACCEKWGIPFLDLNKHCPPLGCIATLKSTYTSSGDGYHPNEHGYAKYYTDRIAAWMESL